MKFNSFYKHSNDVDHKQEITSLGNMCLSLIYLFISFYLNFLA